MNDELDIQIIKAVQKARAEDKTPAFVYDRVSTPDQQKTGYSLDIQEETAARYAEHRGLEIVHAFKIAESSWKKIRRKVFHQMIELALKHKVHNLIFKNTDRASRNYEDLALLERLVDDNNFTLHFWESNKAINRASTHNDRMILGIEITVAKHTSDKISDDIRQMIAGKVARGIPPGPSPMGYKYDDKARIHLKDPDTQHVINFMFKAYDEEGLNLRELRDRLNDRGYRSPKGYKWTVPFLHHLLRNPFYAGYFNHKGKIYKAHHEPYISFSEYEERIKRMGARNRSKRRASGKHFPFAGLLKCGDCKRMLTGELKKEKFMYWSHLHNGSDFTRLREIDILKYVDTAIRGIVLNPDFEDMIMSSFERASKTIDETQDRRRKTIRQRLGQIEAEKYRVLSLYAKNIIDDATIDEKVKQYRLEEAGLNRDLEGLGVVKTDVLKKIGDVCRAVRGFHELYFRSEKADKGRLLASVAEMVLVFPGRVEIVWNAAWRVILDPELLRFKETVIKNKRMLPRTNEFITTIDRLLLYAISVFPLKS